MEKKGIVRKSTGSWYTVQTRDGEQVDCRLRGQFRIKGIKSTNPVVVGDHVKIDAREGVIREIEERKNHIVRKATKLSKRTHVIAANIDLVLLVATISQPRTSTGFIDRFLCSAEAYHIPAAIIFNKTDIYDFEETQQLDQLVKIYERIGYPCLKVSATEGTNLDQLIALMKDKVNLVSGHSGVGKSTLINAIDEELDLRIGDISTVHQKGKHTTTFAEMFELSFGGYIIDTPGIKEFGLAGIEREEISHYFPEMMELLPGCKFYNCLHLNEPGCAVKEAVEAGEIAESRYHSYVSIMSGDLRLENEYNT